MLKKSCNSKYHAKKQGPGVTYIVFTVGTECGSIVPKLSLNIFHLVINPKYKHLV